MTRKVTAHCSRKRLLLLLYTYKLFSTYPHSTSTVFKKTGSYSTNNERRYNIPSRLVLWYYCAEHSEPTEHRKHSRQSQSQPQQQHKYPVQKERHRATRVVVTCLCLLAVLSFAASFILWMVGNGVSSKVYVYFCPCLLSMIRLAYISHSIVYTFWQDTSILRRQEVVNRFLGEIF